MVEKMRIYTITLNPAFDVHASAENLVLGRENLASVTSRDAGGKGINISRALSANGVENTAIAVLGKENGAEFKSLIGEYGINCVSIEKEGRIRENLTFHADGGETRISFSGFDVDNSVLDEIGTIIELDGDTVVTFTGSVPSGVDISECKKFLLGLKAKGARIVIDSKSFTLDDLIEVKPWLIKPNGEEIEVYSGRRIIDFEDCRDIAFELFGKGIENVMISLGEMGAMLVSSDGAYVASPPAICAISTVGAGDSTIAGFIAAFADGEGAEGSLCRAVAYGTAACLREGTAPPIYSDVKEILKTVSSFAL